ncbi:MAG: carbon-nitrogen hydrolase [Gemmataceae bacterium]
MTRLVTNRRNFTVGLIQMKCSKAPEANLNTALVRIREAAREGAQVICLPELFLAQYFCQTEDPAVFDLAEPIPGPSTEAIGRVAAETQTVVIASLFERRAVGLYHNTVAVLDTDGSLLGIYRKMHIPDDPLYYEKFYFTPGDTGFKTFPTKFGNIGVLICWDQWFPEGARLTALRGADILFYPTAIGWHPREKEIFGEKQHQAWELIQRSHAVANGVFVAAVNRVGYEGTPETGLEFWGASFLCDPFGGLIRRASHYDEDILVAECNLNHQEEIRKNWPFFRDRRIDAYGEMTQRFLDSD